jgi:integrase
MPQYSRRLKKGIRWYYKFSYLGITYHSKAIYHTKQETAKAERARYIEVEEQSRSVNSNHEMKLLELINLRLDYIKTAKSVKYYNENRRYLKALFDKFLDVKISEISKSEIQALLINQSRKLKNCTKDNYAVNAMIRCFKSLFFYGINYLELDIKNPCIGIRLFPIQKKIKYIPSIREIEDVMEKCDEYQRLLVEFVRDTGCRISEALNLSRSDVFDGYVILYTRKSKSSNLTPREAKFDTSKFTLKSDSTEKIFSRWSDFPKFLAKKTNGKWTWHNLRHRFASILSQNNTPLFEIMSKLGHNNIETTQNYLQLLFKS